MKQDVYEKITAKIIKDLEQGVRPWMKPWNAEHAAGRITRPLRANGIPYRGINIVMLWMEAMERGYGAPIWMTFKQALELGAHVRMRKGISTMLRGKGPDARTRYRRKAADHPEATGRLSIPAGT
jgi:antirestriction protein ArdC